MNNEIKLALAAANDAGRKQLKNKGVISPSDSTTYQIMTAISNIDTNILDLLVNLNFVASKGEAKRLIQGGGVKLEGEKSSDMGFIVTPNMDKVLQAGKRKFAKLV